MNCDSQTYQLPRPVWCEDGKNRKGQESCFSVWHQVCEPKRRWDVWILHPFVRKRFTSTACETKVRSKDWLKKKKTNKWEQFFKENIFHQKIKNKLTKTEKERKDAFPDHKENLLKLVLRKMSEIHWFSLERSTRWRSWRKESVELSSSFPSSFWIKSPSFLRVCSCCSAWSLALCPAPPPARRWMPRARAPTPSSPSTSVKWESVSSCKRWDHLQLEWLRH